MSIAIVRQDSSTFVMGHHRLFGMRPLSLIHVAQREVRVARTSGFFLKIFLRFLQPHTPSYDSPGLSIIRSISAAYRV